MIDFVALWSECGRGRNAVFPPWHAPCWILRRQGEWSGDSAFIHLGKGGVTRCSLAALDQMHAPFNLCQIDASDSFYRILGPKPENRPWAHLSWLGLKRSSGLNGRLILGQRNINRSSRPFTPGSMIRCEQQDL